MAGVERQVPAEAVYDAGVPGGAAVASLLAVEVPRGADGKVRAQLTTSKTAEEGAVKEAAFALPEIEKWAGGKELKKFVYVPGKIVNIVVGK